MSLRQLIGNRKSRWDEKREKSTFFRSSGAMLSTIRDDDTHIDRKRINRTVEETGINSFGILVVEVWLLDDTTGAFTCPDGGYWTDPLLDHYTHSEPLRRIIDPDHSDFMHPHPQIAGTGLAGYFWSFVSSSTLSSSGTRLTEGLGWRDLNAIAIDPDQPPNPRLEVMVEAGIGKGAGIPFNILGQKGIVLYLARATANVEMLDDPENAQYLQFCANAIGSMAALTIPRHHAVHKKRLRLQDCCKRVSTKFTAARAFEEAGAHRSKHHMQQAERAASIHQSARFCSDALVRAYRSVRKAMNHAKDEAIKKATSIVLKSRGSMIQPPPPHPVSSAWLAFVSSFSTLMLIYGIAVGVDDAIEFRILLGPFSSLMCAQYALTAAPASQPRTIIIGQVVSCLGAYLFRWTLVEMVGWNQSIVASLATAVAIFNMAVLGVVHPPAAGAAFLFANGDQHIAVFALVLFGEVVSILAAMFFNNWSDKRQYPIYWAFGSIQNIQKAFQPRKPPTLPFVDEEREGRFG